MRFRDVLPVVMACFAGAVHGAAAHETTCSAGSASFPIEQIKAQSEIVFQGKVTSIDARQSRADFGLDEDGKYVVQPLTALKGALPTGRVEVRYTCWASGHAPVTCNTPVVGDTYVIWRRNEALWGERTSCFPKLRN